ncbi:MAG: hypothetical protein GY775_19460 [Candidatus Scalindua sp.]|nr:hypothetical protein [Candidatus Scalindua sp.]
MKSFQILDKSEKPVAINTLDAEVCKLQGKTPNAKHYCGFENPNDYEKGVDDYAYVSTELTGNWFDTIGWLIASENKSLHDIIDYYKDIMKEFLGMLDKEGNRITIEMIYPNKIKLLKNWINKGYVARQVD